MIVIIFACSNFKSNQFIELHAITKLPMISLFGFGLPHNVIYYMNFASFVSNTRSLCNSTQMCNVLKDKNQNRSIKSTLCPHCIHIENPHCSWSQSHCCTTYPHWIYMPAHCMHIEFSIHEIDADQLYQWYSFPYNICTGVHCYLMHTN